MPQYIKYLTSKDHLPYVLIASSVAIYWHKLLSFRNIIFYDLIYKLFYPNYILLAQEMRNFTFPFWNPYIYSGLPFFATIQYGVLYPLNILFILFSFPIAYSLSIIIHSLIAGFGMYKLVKLVRPDGFTALFGSLLFMFNGFIIFRVEFFSNYFSYSWIPAIIYYFHSFSGKSAIKTVIITAVLLAIQFFAGFPQYSFCTVALLFASLFTIPKTAKSNTAGTREYFITIGIFLLMIAIQIFPSVDFTENTVRWGDYDYDFITAYSLNPVDFIKFTFFPLWNWYFESISGDMHVVGNYFGIVSLIPFVAGIFVVGRYRKRLIIYGGLLIVSLLLSFGKYLPGNKILFDHLFFMRIFRFPSQWMIIFVFCYSIVASYGLYCIPRKLRGIIVALLFSELFLFGIKTYAVIDRKYFSSSFPNIEFLKGEKTLCRFMLTPKTRSVSNRSGRSYLDAWYNFANTLYPNISMVFGLYDADGFESLRYKKYEDILNQIGKNPVSRWISLLNIKYILSFWRYNMAGYNLVRDKSGLLFYENMECLPRIYCVSYVTKLPENQILDFVEKDSFELGKEIVVDLAQGKKLKHLYDSRSMSYTIDSIEYLPDRISFNITADKQGVAVISDVYDKSWQVKVNNKKSDVLCVNYCLRGVQVNKGKSTVELWYQSVNFVIGAYISCITFLLSLLIIVKNKS